MIGLIAKKNEKVCFSKGIFTTDSESLAEYLYSISNINIKFLENFNGNIQTKEWLKLIESELSSLKMNNVADYAEDRIEYYKSNNENIPADFHAIGYDGNWEYDPKYLEYETWSRYRVFRSALEKVIRMNTIKLSEKESISNEDMHLHNNIIKLDGIAESLYTIYAPDEIAILCGPY